MSIIKLQSPEVNPDTQLGSSNFFVSVPAIRRLASVSAPGCRAGVIVR